MVLNEILARIARFRPSRPVQCLVPVLLVSFLTRAGLILAGGQYYWTDEGRYETARHAARLILRADIVKAVRDIAFDNHFGFALIALPPALLEQLVYPNLTLPALYLCLFSVANIGLLWAIARRAGATETESLIAAGLLALSTSSFYYSRHLFPYDASLTFGLAALFMGIGKPSTHRSSLLCGLFASLCFLVYNGYWSMAALALLVHLVFLPRGARQIARRAVFFGLAFAAPPLCAAGVGALFGFDALERSIFFSNTITEGAFSEGWSLPFEYLWHTEHFLFPLWVVSFVYCLWTVGKGGRAKNVVLGIAGLLFVYGVLVLLSVGLQKFVVYGRLVRQCTPFFCLLTAHALEGIRTSKGGGRRIFAVLFALIFVQAFVNQYACFKLTFPADFRVQANVAMDNEGGLEYGMVNVRHIYPEADDAPDREHRVVLEAPHPLEFLPYQYEGFSPAERAELRSHKIEMQLVQFSRE